MAKHYYNIYIKPKQGYTREHIEKRMNLALDWFRFAPNNYIVYSSSDIKKWMVRLKPLVQPRGRLLITEIDVNNRNGWMAKDFWEWLREERK